MHKRDFWTLTLVLAWAAVLIISELTSEGESE